MCPFEIVKSFGIAHKYLPFGGLSVTVNQVLYYWKIALQPVQPFLQVLGAIVSIGAVPYWMVDNNLYNSGNL